MIALIGENERKLKNGTRQRRRESERLRALLKSADKLNGNRQKNCQWSSSNIILFVYYFIDVVVCPSTKNQKRLWNGNGVDTWHGMSCFDKFSCYIPTNPQVIVIKFVRLTDSTMYKTATNINKIVVVFILFFKFNSNFRMPLYGLTIMCRMSMSKNGKALKKYKIGSIYLQFEMRPHPRARVRIPTGERRISTPKKH